MCAHPSKRLYRAPLRPYYSQAHHTIACRYPDIPAPFSLTTLSKEERERELSGHSAKKRTCIPVTLLGVQNSGLGTWQSMSRSLLESEPLLGLFSVSFLELGGADGSCYAAGFKLSSCYSCRACLWILCRPLSNLTQGLYSSVIGTNPRRKLYFFDAAVQESLRRRIPVNTYNTHCCYSVGYYIKLFNKTCIASSLMSSR